MLREKKKMSSFFKSMHFLRNGAQTMYRMNFSHLWGFHRQAGTPHDKTLMKGNLKKHKLKISKPCRNTTFTWQDTYPVYEYLSDPIYCSIRTSFLCQFHQ